MSIEQTIADEARASNAQVVDRIMGRDVTRGELLAQFNRIAPAQNWKAPIDVVIRIADDREMETLRRAVVFFTGSVPGFVARGRNFYRVIAAGYYATIGA